MGLYSAQPVGAYSLTAKAMFNGGVPMGGLAYFGIFMSDGTKYVAMHVVHGPVTPGTTYLSIDTFTTISAFDTTPFISASTEMTGPIWFRLLNDNTNISWQISRDGLNFVNLIAPAAKGAYLTATRVGISIIPTSQSTNVTFESLKVA
jgi:hypothetical protein